MLDGVRKLLKDEGILIITTPNILSVKFFLHTILFNKEPSSDFHVLAFTPKTLCQLLSRYGFGEFELFFDQWVLPSWRNRIFRFIITPILKIRPSLADTIILLAKKVKNYES